MCFSCVCVFVFQGSDLVHRPGKCCPECSSVKPSCLNEGKSYKVSASDVTVKKPSQAGNPNSVGETKAPRGYWSSSLRREDKVSLQRRRLQQPHQNRTTSSVLCPTSLSSSVVCVIIPVLLKHVVEVGEKGCRMSGQPRQSEERTQFVSFVSLKNSSC